ncbi:hypothetical protein GCM10020367_17670 [Streptomyces sannanensis]|uniref:Lipoprotein n=1 Tax=Streptomyces sannanensis TaxID=285536 RepID=A0ABP6S837_9ACTN
MPRRLLSPLLIPLALGLAGCSQPRVCTLIGADSGVTVRWRSADFADAGPATFRLCVRDTCEEHTLDVSQNEEGFLTLRLPDDIGAVTVPVRFTVTPIAGGQAVLDARANARLKESHPNGEECSFTVFQAGFRADRSKGLTSSY